MSRNMHCKEIERLMYLKEDELSREEGEVRQEHLQECEECRKQYQEISHYMDQAQYDDLPIDSRFLEARVLEQYKKHKDEKFRKGVYPLRRQILKALSVASIFFFIIYSIEQVKTVKKISGLEQSLATTNGISINQKGQLLVLNHFYDVDDLKQIINPDLNYQAIAGSIFLKTRQNSLNLNLLSLSEKKLIQQLIESKPIGKAFLNRGLYGNSHLMNLSSDKN